MAQGPILIFDKSSLQALNPDEAHWVGQLFHVQHHSAFLHRETLRRSAPAPSVGWFLRALVQGLLFRRRAWALTQTKSA